ncbi:uncharacterized protein N7479_010514 [Penicillium vulpinum]|uniref:uncharacterized protein n=1 Tax=Penicillium vulpinum TaxID=29845 RepID=UPI0025473252|nr:uncharacterized protein N7479_010514 [Penicillium vulpinum]KAJ5952101.1 hypothetical protein N7479_010514 [Penicillium vulpinum]
MPSHYNCSGPQHFISIDTDITGYRVIANYVATAGIAVLLIIIYFFVGYEPALDPFRKTDQDTLNQSFRPNPIDEIILRTVRYIPKRLMGARKVHINARVEKAFIKCILEMSDIQIITGLSILISGYVQLHQGISSFHWIVIVDLAWFSSLTHLACLTLLRNYLYNHSLQRTWRLVSMAVLVIFLTIALSFTGDYYWTSFKILPDTTYFVRNDMIDPAMCHLSFSPSSMMAYCGMIISILLIILGFVTRIIKLYKTISIDGWGKARARISMQARHLLSFAFTWCCSSGSRNSLKRTLLYRPLLTTFLVARLFLDGWSSMFLEVCWLIAGFFWGTIRLFGVLLIIQTPVYQDDGSLGPLIQDSDERDSDWGFGQVVALVLLFAPLITVIKYFFTYDDKQSTGVVMSCSDHTIYGTSYLRSQSTSLTASPFEHQTSRRPDDPNSKWDDHSQTLGGAILYFILVCIAILILICITNDTANLLDNLILYCPPAVIGLIGVWEVVLFSLAIELDLSDMPLWFQRLLQMVNILFFILSAFFSDLKPTPHVHFPFAWIGTYSFLLSGVAFYVLWAVLYRILGSTS